MRNSRAVVLLNVKLIQEEFKQEMCNDYEEFYIIVLVVIVFYYQYIVLVLSFFLKSVVYFHSVSI